MKVEGVCVEGICVFLITRRVAFEVRLSPCVCWCTCRQYSPVSRRVLFVCPGVGVWCVGVCGHTAYRVSVAHEDKMITFVVREIAL